MEYIKYQIYLPKRKDTDKLLTEASKKHSKGVDESAKNDYTTEKERIKFKKNYLNECKMSLLSAITTLIKELRTSIQEY